ncbi:HK97 family phage prohead protease [Acinetobacter sp. ME22]|uniref:HK97 family phage prohead protease n=1 Tax=Acinetobacter sp. ME22 TaxID=2904802 RepID=UPI001EDC18F2|nr:HK97 family phage prohead protease [Acinetobacter sp. ME22]MCG2575193.1 HK97 family phage prohead protease [Acinetobacter sp. ME22]
MEIKHLNVPLEIKSVSETGEFEGYGSVFGVEDSYGDAVMKGAFLRSLTEWTAKGRLPSMLWQHKMSEPIGIYTEMKEDEHGLYVKGRLLIDDDPLAKRAYAHLKAGSLGGLSIGYILRDYEYDKSLGIYKLKDIDLWEVSLVTFPANEEAQVTNVKTMLQNGETPSPSNVEKALREALGFSRTQAKAFMAKGYSALNQRDVDLDQDALQSLKDLKNIFAEGN